MMKMFATMTILLGLVSCGSPKQPERTEPKGDDTESPVKRQAQIVACPEEAYFAVLNKLWPVLGREPRTIDEKYLQEQENRIACIREWAQSIKDPCQNQNYLHWLDFYENRVAEYRRRLSTNEEPSERARYEQERREQERRVREYEASHPVPQPPPSCERTLIQRVK